MVPSAGGYSLERSTVDEPFKGSCADRAPHFATVTKSYITNYYDHAFARSGVGFDV